jgi:peptidoglycan/LPS O-acetylase OafA/YrhL
MAERLQRQTFLSLDNLHHAQQGAVRERGYMIQLDALRFFAVLGVMVLHNWRPPALPWIFSSLDWGALGVRLFFVLSGFLITGILLNCRSLAAKTGQSSLFYVRQFYIRRFLRIFPVYYLVLVVLYTMNFPLVRELWLWLVSYTSNLYISFHGEWIGRVGHFWTLALEEQFYLVWPWLVLFVPRRRLLPVLLAIIALAPLYRFYAVSHYPADFATGAYTKTTFSLACLDSLGLGALLAIAFHSGWSGDTIQKYLVRFILPIGVGSLVALQLLAYYHITPGAYITFSDTSVALIFCWLVGSASRGFKGAAGRLLEFRPLVYLGKITYGIYIFHNLVPFFLVAYFRSLGIPYQEVGFVNFILSSSMAILLAALSWHLFEQPVNNLKQYFDYAASPSTRLGFAPEQDQVDAGP